MGFCGSEIDVQCGKCGTIMETSTMNLHREGESCIPYEGRDVIDLYCKCTKCQNKIYIYYDTKNVSRKRNKIKMETTLKAIDGKVEYSLNSM